MITGLQLREARALAGLTPIELAKRAGLNVNTVYRYARFGDAFIRCDNATFRKILAVLEEEGVVWIEGAFQMKDKDGE